MHAEALLIAALLTVAPLAHGLSAELVMFETEGCEYCALWNSQVGEIYAETELGKIAPLRRVDMDAERPMDLRHIKGIRYSPTFVVVDGQREVGRMTGYIDESFFWGYLEEIIKTLDPGDEKTSTSPR